MALPGSAVLFSLLWPTTRHGSAAGALLCVIGGAALGIVLAPLASQNFSGASWTQMAFFAVTGAAFGGLYVLFARRFAEPSHPQRNRIRDFRHRLSPVATNAPQ